MTHIENITNTKQHTHTQVSRLASRYGSLSAQVMEKFVTLMEQLKVFQITGNEDTQAEEAANQEVLKVAEEAAGKRNNNARLSYKDMFHLYDVDNSGEIDFDEFCGVIKTLHLDLRQYHLLKFFSKNAGADGSMNEVEFQVLRVLLVYVCMYTHNTHTYMIKD